MRLIRICKYKLLVFLSVSFLGSLGCGKDFDEKFYQIRDYKKRNEKFVEIMLPYIKKSNENILNQRKKVKTIILNAYKSHFRNIDKKSLNFLVKLKEKYKIQKIFDLDAFLTKIDKIPTSLALAQGAIESAWGMSRFAKEANNIFGRWTWGKKGLIPNEREEGKKHKIKIFDNIQSSVEDYMLTLNRHHPYENLRNARKNFRKKGNLFNGLIASDYMIMYSQTREVYVKLLKKTILDNEFLRYDYGFKR